MASMVVSLTLTFDTIEEYNSWVAYLDANTSLGYESRLDNVVTKTISLSHESDRMPTLPQ
ncbi:MAG: hypothetical protein A3E01_02680 [Gammaproteobacteria bacterium RIFCSPHIGHO2_12_FULL_63_22]|nr:MAG: hypothetical protein A3E01_02680 [Gammaproteobacteria bacterium RIFCSPHIGHO2_12_FULL_63_22]